LKLDNETYRLIGIASYKHNIPMYSIISSLVE
jgi:hypothetical protein